MWHDFCGFSDYHITSSCIYYIVKNDCRKIIGKLIWGLVEGIVLCHQELYGLIFIELSVQSYKFNIKSFHPYLYSPFYYMYIISLKVYNPS